MKDYDANPNELDDLRKALAAKTVLWPIAGIALLGAAAALVSNPVLLQLGVVSGKRRRRDTEEITGPDFPSDTFLKYAEKMKKQSNEDKIQVKEKFRRKSKKQDFVEPGDTHKENFNRRLLKTDILKSFQSTVGTRKIKSSVRRNIDQVVMYPENHKRDNDDEKFIPIPIKLRIPKDVE
uniref:Uncharacterized protein n=1 Tax=Heliothis virescens TaxID=7102 RepID=A0A2A4K8G8_HELVI